MKYKKARVLFILAITLLTMWGMSISSFAQADESAAETEEETEEESLAPLTPDGNLTLVDDIYSTTSGKQFITVQTKAGDYFYIIIDRDDSGNQTVHFLNQVDAADLYALMDDEEVTDYLARAAETETAAEEETEETEAALALPVETETEAETIEDTPEQSSINWGSVFVFLIGIAIIAGLLIYKFKSAEKKKEENEPDEGLETDYSDEDLY